MATRRTYALEERAAIIERALSQELNETSRHFGVPKSTVQAWAATAPAWRRHRRR